MKPSVFWHFRSAANKDTRSQVYHGSGMRAQRVAGQVGDSRIYSKPTVYLDLESRAGSLTSGKKKQA
jgi:hypothetical protein